MFSMLPFRFCRHASVFKSLFSSNFPQSPTFIWKFLNTFFLLYIFKTKYFFPNSPFVAEIHAYTKHIDTKPSSAIPSNSRSVSEKVNFNERSEPSIYYDTYDSQTEENNSYDSNIIAKTLKCEIRIFML